MILFRTFHVIMCVWRSYSKVSGEVSNLLKPTINPILIDIQENSMMSRNVARYPDIALSHRPTVLSSYFPTFTPQTSSLAPHTSSSHLSESPAPSYLLLVLSSYHL